MAASALVRRSDSLKGPLGFSIAFHALLAALVVVSAIRSNQGESWGGPGGSISVGLVGNVPAIPLPRPETVTQNRVVDNSKGLYKSEIKPPEIPADSIPIPKFKELKPPKYVTRKSRVLEDKTPPPSNAVPYGGGGQPNIPYSAPVPAPAASSAFQLGQATQAGLALSGAGGNFGSRYGWYVQAVQRRVSSNWLQSSVDPTIQFAPRAVVTFQILRNGTITNIQVERSSGNYSVDSSAVRAVTYSSPVQPLPNDYSGSYVNVEFWFDFHR